MRCPLRIDLSFSTLTLSFCLLPSFNPVCLRFFACYTLMHCLIFLIKSPISPLYNGDGIVLSSQLNLWLHFTLLTHFLPLPLYVLFSVYT